MSFKDTHLFRPLELEFAGPASNEIILKGWWKSGGPPRDSQYENILRVLVAESGERDRLGFLFFRDSFKNRNVLKLERGDFDSLRELLIEVADKNSVAEFKFETEMPERDPENYDATIVDWRCYEVERSVAEQMTNEPASYVPAIYEFQANLELYNSSLAVLPDEDHLIICSMSFHGEGSIRRASGLAAARQENWSFSLTIGEYSNPGADDTLPEFSSFDTENRKIRILLDTDFFSAPDQAGRPRNYLSMLQPLHRSINVHGRLTVSTDRPHIKINSIHFRRGDW